jgi:chemotaxis protein methyltransferase WspC
MKQLEQMLRDEVGLEAAAIGSSLIERAARLRMKSLGLGSVADYMALLRNSREEWTEFVEAVLVTETWFFRDPEGIAACVRLALDEWLPAHPAAMMRVLSLPCASGEEPYSLAMALRDANVPAGRFQIDAADISARALALARRGVYGKNSFRGSDLAFQHRYFQPAARNFVLQPAICDSVRFQQANLLSPAYAPPGERYDFIFCRNLLIYLTPPARRKALAWLGRLLGPDGVLFVGPAEHPVVLEHGFVSIRIPMAFACRKGRPERLDSPAAQPAHPERLTPAADRAALSPPPQGPAHDAKLPWPRVSASAETASLERARRLADAGQLREAAARCEAVLRENPSSAQAYFLLGLVREAGGDATAIDCYRKTLYLQPDHYDALLQMALLAKKNGDAASAGIFKRRAQRLKTEEG